MTVATEPNLSPAGLELAIIHAEAYDILGAALQRRGIKMDDLPAREQEWIVAGVHAGVSATLDFMRERFNR